VSLSVKPARFNSLCPRCFDPIVRGDPIVYNADEKRATHVDCHERPLPQFVDDDAQRVLDHLLANEEQLTKFEQSLLDHYRRHGTLTAGQLDIQLARMGSRRAMQGRRL
jgi:hypothetical protein